MKTSHFTKKLILFTCLICFQAVAFTQAKVIIKIDGQDKVTFDSSRIDVKNADFNTFIGENAGKLNTPAPGNQGRFNTFLGHSSGQKNTVGSFNTFFGYGSGDLNQDGGRNTFIGREAGAKNTLGFKNVFIGDLAGYGDGGFGTSRANIFIGTDAGYKTSTSENNIGLGDSSLVSIIHGENNVAIGTGALKAIVDGKRNIGIGSQVLKNNGDGEGNIAIGYKAGGIDNTSNKLYIHNDSTAVGKSLIYGEFDSQLLRVNGEFQIGTEYKLPMTDGAAFQVMTTDGSGQVGWEYVPAEDPFNELVDSMKFNYPFLELYQAGNPAPYLLDLLILGDDADADPNNEIQTLSTSGDSLYILGGNGVKLSGAFSSTMLIDGDGDTKVELFENGLTDIIGVTVDNNQILGIDHRRIQFFNNNSNTLVGGGAGLSLASGGSNSFFGKDSGLSLASGGSNTFIGQGAGGSQSSGSDNVYIGAGSGPSTISGTGNVFIGKLAGQGISGDNKLVIENSGSASPLIYGDFNLNRVGINGNLGVGVQNPGTRFHVLSQSTTAARFESIDNTIVEFYRNGSGNGFIQTLNDDFIFGKDGIVAAGDVQLFNNGNYMTLETDGDVSIGTTSPVSSKLYVQSSGTTPVIKSQVQYSGNSDVVAVQGNSNPAGGYGYGGYFTGGYRGVYGSADAGTSTFTATGVYGVATSTNGEAHGVYGSASGGTANWAGYFNSGNVHISNELRIGTTSGKSGYAVAINGKVVSEELLIEDSGNWPDYVFDEEYELMSLEEVEQSIIKNKHLPGIPSAAEVEENGILMGDMQKKMMEKIEELTLHLIDLQKKIKTLEIQISESN